MIIWIISEEVSHYLYNCFIVFVCHLMLATLIGCMVISRRIARRKGYASYYWIVALHPVGLILISQLDALPNARTPEEMRCMASRANWIGATLSLVGLLLGIVLILMVYWRNMSLFQPPAPLFGH